MIDDEFVITWFLDCLVWFQPLPSHLVIKTTTTVQKTRQITNMFKIHLDGSKESFIVIMVSSSS